MTDPYELLIGIKEYEELQEKDRKILREVARALKAQRSYEEQDAELKDLIKETKIWEMAKKIEEFKKKAK
ncbi:MAG: hypothetical protein WBG50_28705 [Desulfomonilaceae bacterium]